MPFICMRARAVLVWLGLLKELNEILWELAEEFVKEGKPRDSLEEYSSYLKILADNPYWKRVWIIQEIGLARNILVQYGPCKLEWSSFINLFKSNYELRDCLPAKLQKQLDDKYENGLQALIENHRNSLCKEPRDHIYGFVGLAVDCQDGFPMDYGKSPYEVFKDVIRFKTASQPRHNYNEDPDIDTLQFGKTIQSLLGGTGVTPFEEVCQDIPPRISIPSDGEVSLQRAEVLIPARCSGKIVHLGPTYQELMSSLKSMASWRASINHHLHTYDQPWAREESDLFLEPLEEVDEKDLRIVELFDRDISTPVDEPPGCMIEVDKNCLDWGKPEQKVPIPEKPTSTGPRMFLLGGVPDYGDSSSGKLRLTPSASRVGDYIFLVHGIEKALDVRRLEGKITIVGTAPPCKTRYMARQRKEKGESDSEEKLFGTNELSFINKGERFDFYLDIATVYQLLG